MILGPRGYRVLPRQDFDALSSVTPERVTPVRDAIIRRIDQRSADYADLRSEVRAGEIPYDELCPVVDELLPSTNLYVRHLVLEDVRAWQRRERTLELLELALIALTMMYPPSMLVTLPATALLGVARVSLGMTQTRQGRQWRSGTGSGLYSLEQEAEAPTLASRGRANTIGGVLETELSAFSVARMFAEVRASARLLDQLERGSLTITSQRYPTQILRAQNGRLMLIDTEARMILGYGAVRNRQLSWTYARVPFPGGERRRREPRRRPRAGQRMATQAEDGPAEVRRARTGRLNHARSQNDRGSRLNPPRTPGARGAP